MKSNRIRFSELVKTLGPPVAETLWSKPKANGSFMKAVKENRVLTVVQKPTGTQKDFGTIGFDLQPSASYLVFPKPLPKVAGVRVVGIKYDAVEQPKAGGLLYAKPRKQPAQPAKPPPLDKQFEVRIQRHAVVELMERVSAANQSEAKRIALENVQARSFEIEDTKVTDEVKAVREAGPDQS